MPHEPDLPEGKTIRTHKGGTDSLKNVLVDLRKYSFSGYVRTILPDREEGSIGYIIVKGGNPEATVHLHGPTKSVGKVALRRIWEDTGREACTIEVHARVDVDSLLGRMRMFNGRAKRDHVHARVFLADDAALQAGMNGLDQRIFGKDSRVDFG